jgi:hypothetical protein
MNTSGRSYTADAIADPSPTRQEARPHLGSLGKTLAGYVRAKTMQCAPRQCVVAAFGDGGSDLAGDMKLARARQAPFVRRLSDIKHRRPDILVFAGPHIAHRSTPAILCTTDRPLAQAAFSGLCENFSCGTVLR